MRPVTEPACEATVMMLLARPRLRVGNISGEYTPSAGTAMEPMMAARIDATHRARPLA